MTSQYALFIFHERCGAFRGGGGGSQHGREISRVVKIITCYEFTVSAACLKALHTCWDSTCADIYA
jgi:hypothetical protein